MLQHSAVPAKDDLRHLNLRLQHKEPKEKGKRALKEAIIELIYKFGSYPTEQIAEIFNCVLSNLERDVQFFQVEGDATAAAFEALKALKGASTSLGLDVRAIICICVEAHLRALSRDEQRALGVRDETLKRIEEIREDFKKGGFHFLKRQQPRRKSAVMQTNLPELGEKFLDEHSTPVKFS